MVRHSTAWVLACFIGTLTFLGGGFFIESQAAVAGDDCEHTVKSGETLGGIALKHGVAESSLIETNPALKKNPDLLSIGQVLDVCAAKKLEAKAAKSQARSKSRSKSRSRSRGKRCGRGGRLIEHEVRSGETLGEIALSYGVETDAIVKRNRALRERPNMLFAGQTLEVCAEERRVTKSKLCNYNTPLHHHEVVPGEHLAQIAGRYGVRRRDLIAWNASLRSNPDMLKVGQRLRVCPEIAPRERSQITYTVQSGDTLGEIALEYGLSPRELQLYQQGKLTDANALREGQKLVVWVDGGIVPGFGGRDDDSGTLSGGIQLPDGRHYKVKWKAAAWGTTKTIRAIQSAVSDYKRRMPGGPKVFVGDISKRAGGKFPPHVSHQHGRDVDVAYVHKGKYRDESRFRRAIGDALDVPRTWALIKAFVDTNAVTYIFMDYRIQEQLYEYARSKGVSADLLDEIFQYPRGRGRSYGIIRHWRGHDDHFHVRFRR